MNWLLCGDGENVRYKHDLDGYCNQYVPANDNFTSLGCLSTDRKLSIAEYRKFMFRTKGRDKKAFTHGALYDWGIDPPKNKPVGADGGTGNIVAGDYTLYYTFFVKFPNGITYETGPSPVSDTVTLSGSSPIDWTEVQPSTYSGTGVTIWRKLYRVVSGTAYWVHTIKDNTTTTYEDNTATITANDSLGTADYDVPPDNIADLEVYLHRIFAIKDNDLWWSETYIPFGFKSTSSQQISPKGEDLVAVVAWGDMLWMPTQKRWYRLSGSDPDTWSVKYSYADKGLINKHTMQATKFGIIGLWYDGIYLFDGMMSRNVTEKIMGREFFEDISTLESGVLNNYCYSAFDTNKYYFYYPSSGTTIDSCLVLDFSLYPEIKAYHDDFIANAHELHLPTGIRYQGKTDGYQYEETGNETITTSYQTGDRVFGNPFKQKNLTYLWYDIDTNSQDVTVTIYADGVSADVITLNESSRTRKRKELAQINGYRFSLAASCSASQDLKIYEPWALEATSFGD
jgi:hypothetical protein